MTYRKVSLWIAGLYLLLAAGTSQGGYIFTLESNAPTQLIPGANFTIEVWLNHNAPGDNDVCDSVVFNLLFSAPGLRYTGYVWYGVFAGSEWDNSQPGLLELPTDITADSYNDPMSPGAIDIHFENFTLEEPFGQGKLLSVFLSVPADWQAPGQEITVQVVPDTITSPGGNVVDGQAGMPLVLNVVQEPSSFLTVAGSMMAVGWILRAGRRFRRRRFDRIGEGFQWTGERLPHSEKSLL